jgi:hypothetical protein
MDITLPLNVLLQIVAIASTGVGVYWAIRTDLKVLHVHREHTEKELVEVKATAHDAHRRITDHVTQHAANCALQHKS